MTIAKNLKMLPVPIQLTILRMSLISNFNYTKDNPEWKWNHEKVSCKYMDFIKWGDVFSRANHPLRPIRAPPTTEEEMNVYWKFQQSGELGFNVRRPCKRYIATTSFLQQNTISLDKMGVVYLFTRYKGNNILSNTHTHMMAPLCKHNSLFSIEKYVRIQDIPKESYDNAHLGASPFWFYRNCRCSNCDLVRELGYEQISEKEKKKVKVEQMEVKETRGEYRICAGSCKKNKPKCAYGNNQWRKGEQWSRCKDCISHLNGVQKEKYKKSVSLRKAYNTEVSTLPPK